MASSVGRNYQKVRNFIFKQIHCHTYLIQRHGFCGQSIRIRTHTNANYAEQVGYKVKMSASQRHSIPAAIHVDIINIKSEAQDNKYPIPKELDKDTILSWISAITKSTQNGDIRAVKLIYSTIKSLNLSTIYPPIYHALIFGHGKVGNIDTMLELYQTLAIHHKQFMSSDPNSLPIISSDIVTTVLNCLAMYRRSMEAIKLFNEYLTMHNCKPDIEAFCMIFRHCTLTANWELSRTYFVKMYKDFNLEPNSLCFKYILETCAFCKPPKYEEAISMLRSMKTDWNIEPNVLHFAAVIRTLATPYALIENPLSQDVAVKTDTNNNFQLYKFKLLHGRLFDNISVNDKLSESDLQRCLDLFDEMTDEYGIIPNDKAFGELFYAMDKANNIEMALKYRQYWKRKFPHVRQQGYSFGKLLSICSNISSWHDAMDIYNSTALMKTHSKQSENGGDDMEQLYIYDNDTMQFQAHHKVQPEIGVFNQLLRCAKNDVSRQIFEGTLDQIEADEIILERIKYIQTQMYHFRYSPNNMTWVFLLQSAAIVESKDLCNRFLKRMFQFFMKPYQQKHIQSFMNLGENDKFYQRIGDKNMIPNEFKDNDNTFENCWDYYDVNKLNIRYAIFNAAISALYWSQQMDKALMFYHDFYFVKKTFTHWHIDSNPTAKDIDIDFHATDPAVAAIGLLYIFQNEFENVYYNLLCQHDDNIINLKRETGEQLEINMVLKSNYNMTKRNIERKGRNLRIITGKGKGNEEGTSILRPWIQLWLENEFNPPIRSYIHPRNVGVLVLDSNDVLAYIRANKHSFSKFNKSTLKE